MPYSRRSTVYEPLLVRVAHMTAAAMPRPTTTPLSIAMMTVGYLFGGFFVGIAIAFPVGSQQGEFHMARNVVAGAIALACMTTAATLWARQLARTAGFTDLRRAGWAGALSFGPAATIAGLVLTLLEQRIVEQGRGPALPLHVVYGMLFVPATLFVAAASAWIIGAGLRLSAALRRTLAVRTGLAAGGAYLCVYLLMDLAGWKVGGPDAARRATMLVVTGLGTLAAAFAGGAAIGTVIVPRASDRSQLS